MLDVSKMAPTLIGIGIYSFLKLLREQPEEAKKVIAEGFPIK